LFTEDKEKAMTGYGEFRADLAGGLRGVTAAFDMLRGSLGTDDALYASEQLARAAERYEHQVAGSRRAAFDEALVKGQAATPERERVAAEILAGVVADMEVAAALFVAGGAVGETPEAATPEELEAVSRDLQQVTQAVAGPELAAPDTLRRFGLDEVPAPAKAAAVPDAPTAKAAFEKQLEAVFKALQEETKKVLTAALTGVDDLDDKLLGEAIGMIGKQAGALPGLGKLVSKGLALAVKAMDALTELLGKDLVPELQKKAEELLKTLKEGGNLVDQFLAYSLGVTPSTQTIRELLAQTTADGAAIDSGVQKLLALQAHFTGQAAMMGRLVKALNTGKKFVGKLLPEATAVLLFGTFYLVAMDFTLLNAMDHADTTTLITFVPGVVQISRAALA